MRNILLPLLMCINSIGAAQISDNLSLLVDNSINEMAITETHDHHNSNKNTATSLSWRSFTFYKKYISSQDISSCNFSPSCSEYARQAVLMEGIIVGIANSMDRFTRCNGMNLENYQFQSGKNLLYDPVRSFNGMILKDEILAD